MASDFDRTLQEMASIKRRLAMMMRHGTIHEVGTGEHKGMYRINWGPANIGDGDKLHLSPWIRAGQNHGFAAENMPLVKGQTVTSMSMDPDHLTALVFPHSPSELNPMDGAASDSAHTYRIRKETQAQGQQAEGGDPQYPKRQDDDDDFQVSRSYDGYDIKAGKDVRLQVTRAGITMTCGGQSVLFNQDGFHLNVKALKGTKT